MSPKRRGELTLSGLQAEAIGLRAEGVPVEAIARMSGVTPKCVRSRLLVSRRVLAGAVAVDYYRARVREAHGA